ncbi:MAG: PH domain-containing protein [Anaerolineales bacterium]|nr:PH domain-containing protein [Anaerolineales bacterium]
MTNDSYLQSLLAKDERILHITHRHWLVLVREVASELLLSLALIVLITLLLVFPIAGPLVALGYLLLLLPLISLSHDALEWYNRKYVVTDRRVIFLEGVFNKDVTDSSLEKVNDVKLEQSMWGRVLDYGDVEILTGSELGVNKFKTIARPIQFKTAMLNAKHALDSGTLRSSARPAAANGAADLPGLLGQLDALRQSGVLTEEEFQQKKKQLLAKL